MTEERIISLIEQQRAFFMEENTFPISKRKEMLLRLKACISEETDNICNALEKDLGKGSFESYMCEVGLVLSELNYMMKKMKAFSKPHRVKTPLSQFLSKSYTVCSPYGVVLVMSPWNYPFMLTFEPMIDAIAAGNTVIAKPSAYSPYTTEIISRIVHKVDPSGNWINIVEGGREENKALFNQRFDFIFFTGSVNVGKEVMRKASENLTPITLELGGKSPCIVMEDADIEIAARRIVFGKFLNCGQTCVAPDYVLCHQSIKKAFVDAIEMEITKQYGNALTDLNYGKIINEKHFKRIMDLMDAEKTVFGGGYDESLLKIEPTIMLDCDENDNVMQEEIFGPVLPIIGFESINEVKQKLKKCPNPLALYVFTKNKKAARNLTERLQFGGGCINDTIIHLATSNMGFGGVGNSGIGSYHGKAGFMNFSHCKSIVNKSTAIDLAMRYRPYTERNFKAVKLFLK